MKKDYKSGFVTLIGRPNVGKSTLMTQLIGQKIAITSNKPQTTRNRIQTVLTTDDGQIVFVDTPGIHKAKNKLGEYMVNVAERTLNEVDVVLWLVEPTTFIGAGEQHIISQLKKVTTPVVLVINKIDSVKKEDVLPAIAAYKDVYDFAEIVPVSARNGDNTDELVKVIMKYLPYGPQFYDEDTITDQPERQIVAELIREKALHCLQEEIPHGIAVAIDSMKVRNKVMHIDATIICERDSHKGIIIGKKGSMLKKIGSTARYEIEKMLIEEDLDVKKLPDIWADKYEEYLGIRPENPAEGVLQDIHWSQGSFGYFPSYALGSAFGAQLYYHMKEIMDFDGLLKDGRVDVIRDYLREHIHQYGKLKDSRQILKEVTGEDFNPEYYVRYLKEKYSAVYGL